MNGVRNNGCACNLIADRKVMTWKVCIRLIAGVGGPVKRDIIQPNARWPGYLV